jgi:hypothetical protein
VAAQGTVDSIDSPESNHGASPARKWQVIIPQLFTEFFSVDDTPAAHFGS